jgi:hypothetical protein
MNWRLLDELNPKNLVTPPAPRPARRDNFCRGLLYVVFFCLRERAHGREHLHIHAAGNGGAIPGAQIVFFEKNGHLPAH